MSTRAPTRSAISAKTDNYNFSEKLEKSSSRCKHNKEGPDKVCNFCDFCENCENYNFCEKLEKSSSPWKLVKDGPDKVCDFCENCENCNFCKKVGKIVESMETCQRAPTRCVISAKNLRNRRVNVNMSKRAPTRSAMFVKTARIAIILKSAKNWKNR